MNEYATERKKIEKEGAVQKIGGCQRNGRRIGKREKLLLIEAKNLLNNGRREVKGPRGRNLEPRKA